MELELGIRVYVRPLGSRISGLFAHDSDVGACVLLNANHPASRRVYTAAYELGHFTATRHEPNSSGGTTAPTLVRSDTRTTSRAPS